MSSGDSRAYGKASTTIPSSELYARLSIAFALDDVGRVDAQSSGPELLMGAIRNLHRAVRMEVPDIRSRLSLTPEVTVEPIEVTVELPKMIWIVERHAIGRYSLAPDLSFCRPDFLILNLSKFSLCTMSSPSTSRVGSAAESIDSASPVSQAGEPWLPEPGELPTTPWYEEKASTLRLSDIPIIKIVAWGGEMVKRLTKAHQKMNASRDQFDKAMGQHAEVLARLEELETLRSREKEAAEAQREALEAQMLVAKEAHEAEKEAREMLEAELEEVKSRAAQATCNRPSPRCLMKRRSRKRMRTRMKEMVPRLLPRAPPFLNSPFVVLRIFSVILNEMLPFPISFSSYFIIEHEASYPNDTRLRREGP
ncbi:hypothetical protein F511_35983 [Dorcoceras hygrometricum]|uniref:Uncharacterized protein n=1 Tax=Dorcoceras hygrometricum TaxID=472368 RepID=A0A2Z7BBM1_9LAMI|nr:hypothetical protein F511_35983 [Dorcoceras hygrometricum]